MITTLALLLFAATPLEECRAKSEQFATLGAVAACQVASEDPSLTTEQRIEAFQLLASALVLGKEPELAERAFLRMLQLDRAARPAADAGPAVQLIYERARSRIPAPPAPPAPAAPSAPPAQPAVAPPPPPPDEPRIEEPRIEERRVEEPRIEEPPVEAASFPVGALGWTITGIGAVVAIGAGVVSSTAVYDLYFNRVPCSSPTGCYPSKLAIGALVPAYNDDGRAKFVEDAGAIILVSATIAVAGALLGGAGVMVALAAPDEG